MTPEAAKVIHDFYLKLRKRRKDKNADLFQVTIRQLESLIRLSSARARAELREEILEQVKHRLIGLVPHAYRRAPENV